MANTASRVVFICYSRVQNVSLWNYVILGVSEASDLFIWLIKIPAVMELAGLSLWWNSIQIYYVLGHFLFLLMIVIITKWIINMPNDTVTLHGQVFYQATYYIFCYFSYSRWVEMWSLRLCHWCNFVLFLWSYTFQHISQSYTFQHISQLTWLYHEVQICIHLVKFFQGSLCT